MLQLSHIVKTYAAGTQPVAALRDVSVSFRPNEFVAVLGPSGCGKTTLLNIIGGLDRYDSGDLVIRGVSTKRYKDRDWDAYRNHTIGFVFQSYNLIPHQTVLGNVELALTLSGISKAERRARAARALGQVGLSDQLSKKPNQLSGGQMQRVAIARALVNNPDILLADEPTGALDTQASVQVMDILKAVSRDRLVIMVTHNPELARQYATRIIRLLDGQVVDDSDPYMAEAGTADASASAEAAPSIPPAAAEAATTMPSPASAPPLVPHKHRAQRMARRRHSMSFFTAFSLSVRNLSTKKARSLLTAFAGSIGIIGIALVLALSNGLQTYIDKMQADTLSAYPLSITEQAVDFQALMAANTRQDLQEYPEEPTVYVHPIHSLISNAQITNTLSQAYIEQAIETIDPELYYTISYTKGVQLNAFAPVQQQDITYYQPLSTASLWSQLIDNESFLLSQYDILGENGRLPQNKNEVVLVVDRYNQISDSALMGLGLYQEGQQALSFNELIGREFRLLLNDDLYAFDGTKWSQKVITDAEYERGEPVKIVGILRPKPETAVGSISGAIAYRSGLTDFLLDNAKTSAIVLWQTEHPDIDAFTGGPFLDTGAETAQQQYHNNLSLMSALDTPTGIYIYPKDFESKARIKQHLDAYNERQTAEADKVYYSDVMELLVSSLNTMIDIIGYVLIAFTAISLFVSSIMIGIITYISVLERTKEIGVLRSLGASKRDISRVFNAETLSIGFVAGLLGIGISLLLSMVINRIVVRLVDIPTIALLDPAHAVVLILISMALTLIAGLIPSRMAAKRDPVTALRSE